MHQAVLVNADVHEGAERRHVRDDARQLHPRLEVLDLLDAVREAERLERLTRVAPGLRQLREDVRERGQADRVGHIFRQIDLFAEFLVLHQIRNRTVQVLCHGIDQVIALGMDRAGIKRILTVADAQEPCCLLKGLGPELRNLFQLVS